LVHDTDPGLNLTPDDNLAAATGVDPEGDDATTANSFTELRDDVAALVEDARTYAEAEIAFQKTRAGLAAKAAGRAMVFLVLAVVLLHIALIALAVGAVIALAPLVTIWGAIAIVVGVMLVGVALLVLSAISKGKLLAAMFAEDNTA
jgi:hypothetical protein